MAGRRFFDFDAFWEAQDRKPVTIKLFGTPHVLPPSLPAKIILKAERFMAERGLEGEVSPGEMIELAHDMFGKERTNAWLERDDFDLDKLQDLFMQTMQLYRGAAEERAEGEQTAPTTEEPQTSSNDGASSLPISDASTG